MYICQFAMDIKVTGDVPQSLEELLTQITQMV